jgi:hypothetical protein
MELADLIKKKTWGNVLKCHPNWKSSPYLTKIFIIRAERRIGLWIQAGCLKIRLNTAKDGEDGVTSKKETFWAYYQK